MTEPAGVIRVPGLTRLDQLELGDDLEPGSVKFENQELDGAKHGEPVSIAIIAVSMVALKVLAAWLLKNSDRQILEKKVELIGADGKSRRVETIRVDLRSSQAPKAAVLKELGRLCAVDVSSLLNKEE